MFISNSIKKIKIYLLSVFFPISIAIIAFLCWIVPSPFNWLFISIYILMMFLPLFSKEGKPYIALLSFLLTITSKNFNFTNIPPSIITLLSVLGFSIIVFIFIHKITFIKGDLLIPSVILLISMVISYLYNSIENSDMLGKSAIYFLYFFIAIIIYSLFSTILHKSESLSYLSKTLFILSFFIYIQLITYFIQHGYHYNNQNISLGWLYNSDIISIILMCSIPFFIYLVYQKQYFYYFAIFTNILFTILLSSNIGILSLLIFLIPIVLSTFYQNKKIYSWASLSVLSIFFITFILLICLNKTFNEKVLSSIKTLLFFKEENPTLKLLFSNSVKQFIKNPYLGKSINYYVYQSNYYLFSSNTYLTVLTLGGSTSLIAFLYFNFKIYYFCFNKSIKEKYLFLLFLLILEFSGLLTNTIFNINILLLFLLCNCVYQMSNRPNDVIVHTDYVQPIYYNK